MEWMGRGHVSFCDASRDVRGFKRKVSERLCIKYKIMAVQPLNKTKIIKKKTNKIRRYQSDEFKRVKVRNHP